MIQFIPESHTYLVNGVIVPSVTGIVTKILGTAYDAVPRAVLNRKAEYGTRVHEWLKAYFLNEELPPVTDTMALSTDQVPSIARYHKIECISAELPVAYKQTVAGTFDLLAYVDGEVSLVDHKTTAAYHEEYLRWQCALYSLCIEHTFGITPTASYCLWLPKNKRAQLIPVTPHSREETIEMLEQVTDETELAY